ncbi:MAG TPA: M28 family peptidase [Chitinophagaceae bacterium]|nr:M28 family peptidase [Chitinophagaceae bacterium]
MRKIGALIFLVMLSFNLQAQSSVDSLKKIVVRLSTLPNARNYKNVVYLNKAADYIHTKFSQATPKVVRQKFDVMGQSYSNVIASFGPDTAARIIIGAHYDVFGEAPGADVNASGVAGLLELARLFGKIDKQLLFRIDLVAYTLEEPPFLNTTSMGSYRHALSLKQFQVKVLGMICLDGIGFFTDKAKSQRNPFFFSRWRTGRVGNYIAIVQRYGNGSWPSRMTYLLNQYMLGMRVVRIKPWITYKALTQSDHQSFWKLGYPAILITNTGKYRNKNFHYDTDTYETLDYFRMAKVVDMVYRSMLHYRT